MNMRERFAHCNGFNTWDEMISTAKKKDVDFSIPKYYNIKNEIALSLFEKDIITSIKENKLTIKVDDENSLMYLHNPQKKNYKIKKGNKK